MNLFFLSIVLIVSGGIFALILWRQFTVMKAVGVLAISAGCFLGLIDALSKLFNPGQYSFSINYLNVLSLSFKIDGLAAFFLVAIFAVSLLAAIYSFHYMNKPEKALRTIRQLPVFQPVDCFHGVGCDRGKYDRISCFPGKSCPCHPFFWSYTIINRRKTEKQGTSILFFPMWAPCLSLRHSVSCTAIPAVLDSLAALPETAKILVFILSFIGFGSKAGVFPFHVWLPHAHPAAPSHISAVMSGVMIKTGIYGIVRMYCVLDLHTPLFGEIVLIAGMVSGILGVVYALGQHDLKRLLAYHSVENIGIILIGIGIGMIGVSSGNPLMAVLGFSGGLLHVLNHSIFKSLLFMGAGIVIQKTGTRSIDALGGLLKNMKITGVTFLIGSLAISGLPPFNGFVSEFLVYLGGFQGVALDKTAFVLSLLAIVSLAVIGGLALACFTKVVGVVFQGEPRSPAAENVNEKGPAMLVPMLVLAGACVVIGVFPRAFVLMALKGVSSLGLESGSVSLEPFLQIDRKYYSGRGDFLCSLPSDSGPSYGFIPGQNH